jgi:hypothetical protein
MQAPTEVDEAPAPPETGSNDANMNRTVKVRRKAANRTEPLFLRRGTRQRHSPRYFESPPPQDEDNPAVARKKRRLEEPLPATRARTTSTTTDEVARKTPSPNLSLCLPPPAVDNDDINANADAVTDTQPNDGATRATARSWTTDEDAQLTSAVTNTSKKKCGRKREKEYGKYYKTDWDAVSALVLGRTKLQCRKRRHYLLDPIIGRANGRTGKWAEDEDSKLKDAIQTHSVKSS